MIHRLNVIHAAAFVALSSTAHATPTDSDGEQFLLVTRDFHVQPIRLAAINDQTLVHMDASRGWTTLDLGQCIALLSIAPADSDLPLRRGMVLLADGQRLPGEAAPAATTVAGAAADHLLWNHPWLGRLSVPFPMIRSVLLTPGASAPEPGDGDVILLVNGDRRSGFVTAIGESVVIEPTEAGGGGGATSVPAVSIPLERVAAITMIAPRAEGEGRRVWFSEGTVLDVQSIAVDDDGYVRLAGGPFLSGPRSTQAQRGRGVEAQPHIGVSEVLGVLFDRHALIPLASIVPSRIEGPSTRYTVPRPVVLDRDAAIGLSTIEFAGPIIVRYTLPPGIERFIAEAELPEDMRQWGDCEVIVRSDDAEVFRATLNAATPQASINLATRGRELTIELTAGLHGPIQDRVRLHRAMLLKSR